MGSVSESQGLQWETGSDNKCLMILKIIIMALKIIIMILKKDDSKIIK